MRFALATRLCVNMKGSCNMKTVRIKLATGEAVSVNVQKRIKYSDMSVIATAICDDVFKDGGYYPYMQELGFVHYVMIYYADYRFDDMDEMMELRASGALAPVFDAIDPEQLYGLRQLIKSMIDYRYNRTGLDEFCNILINEMRHAQVRAENEDVDAERKKEE